MEPDALARRYRYLWMGETSSIVVFLLIYLVEAPPTGHWSGWIALTYGLGVCIGILLQGVAWWRYKLRLLRAGERQVHPRVAARFRRFKRVNWMLIGAFPLVLAAKATAADSFWASGDTWWGIVCITGALLEQVNYYYHQLMYDSRYDWAHLRAHRRLRQGSIAKALGASARGPAGARD